MPYQDATFSFTRQANIRFLCTCKVISGWRSRLTGSPSRFLTCGFFSQAFLSNSPASSAPLLYIGEWVTPHQRILCQGRRCGEATWHKDFVLETGGAYYAFVHDLEHVSGMPRKGGPLVRAFAGLHRGISRVRFLDTGEELAFTHSPTSGLCTIKVTDFPYGMNMVVRVAEMT